MTQSDDFIQKLDNFAYSLELLVDALKEQQKKSPTEAVNSLVNNFDQSQLTSIIESLTEIKKSNERIETGQKDILEAVKSIKAQKEDGVLGEFNKKIAPSTIVDGVKLIMLMAGGIVAIGTAFKLVGDIDVLDVLGLSVAMLLVSEAFARMSEIKNLEYKNVLKMAGILPVMSAAIVLSGSILSNMAPVGLVQAISIGLVGASMGAAAYFLFKAVDKIDITKNMDKILLMPITLPIIAASIVASGEILSHMPGVSIASMLTAIGVSVALVPMMLATGFILKHMKDISVKEVLLLPLIIPAIAGSIVAAAWAFELLPKVDYKEVALTGLSVGVAILAMVPTLYILEKAGLLKPSAIDSLMVGMVAIPLIATAIAGASWAFKLGDYSGEVPGFMWSLKTGLAILAFSVPMLIVGMMAAAGIGLVALGAAVIAIPLVAASIATSSIIIGEGKYGNTPSVAWTAKTGLAILAFGLPMMGLGMFIASTGGLGLLALGAGFLAIPIISEAIVAASETLSKGNYAKYPSLSWSAGVGLSLALFGVSMIGLGATMLTGIGALALYAGASALDTIIDSIVSASHKLNKGNYANYPSLRWASGVSMSIMAFSGAFAMSSIASLMSGLFGDGESFNDFITSVSQAIVTSADIFNKSSGKFDVSKVPSKQWAEGVVAGVGGFADALNKIGDIGGFLGFGGMDVKEFKSAIVVIAQALIASAEEFNKSKVAFDINKVPPVEWSKSVGLIVTSFAEVIKSFSDGGIDFDDKDELDLISYAFSSVARGIVDVSKILSGSKFDVYPPEQWASSISKSFKSYVDAIKNADDVDTGDSAKLVYIFNDMKTVSKILSGLAGIKLPDEATLDSICTTLDKGVTSMAKALKAAESVELTSTLKLYAIGKSIKKYAEMMGEINLAGGFNPATSDNIARSLEKIMKVIPGRDKVDAMYNLADAIRKVGDSIDDMSFDTLETFTKSIKESFEQINNISIDKVSSLLTFSTSLNALALVDNNKLRQTLSTLDAKKKELTGIIDGGGKYSNIQAGTGRQETAEIKQSTPQGKTKQEIMWETLINRVESIDNNTKIIADSTTIQTPPNKSNKLVGKNVND